MINTGYLYSKDSSRLFVNTSLGCSSNCSYCYLPNLGFSKGNLLTNHKTAEEIIFYLEKYSEFKKGPNGTLISLGCFSEVFDDTNKPETIKLLAYFIESGNQIQLSTKKYIDYHDLIEISKLIKYPNQLVILISSTTISKWDKYENLTTPPTSRFKSFTITEKLHIPTALYLKPILPNITIKDLDKYINIIKKYKIKNVIVGSIFKKNGTGSNAPFTTINMKYNKVNDEEIIKDKLKPYCNVYTKSTELMQAMK